MKGQNDPIETENAPKGIIRMSARTWTTTTFELWKMLSDTYKKKVAATKIYLIWRLYNLWMKESGSIHGMMIEDKLKVVLLMSDLPEPLRRELSSPLCAMS